MTNRIPPEGWPDPEHFALLNSDFYRARPHDYFGRRLQSLMLVANNVGRLDDLFAQGVKFGKLSATGAPVGEELEGKTAADRERQTQHFVIAESEVLCHHAGETLLRLYLAHAGTPPSPWLELSRITSPAGFKELVRRRFGPGAEPVDPAGLAEIARVFYLTDNRQSLDPPPDEGAWNRGIAIVDGYLRHFAALFLGKAALYNAGKHGLALLPGDVGVALGDGSILSASGPAIQYLQRRKSADGNRRWFRVTHWVRSDLQVALTYMATTLIAYLWEAARVRYVPAARAEGLSVRLLKTGVDELLRAGEDRALVVDEMALELPYLAQDVRVPG